VITENSIAHNPRRGTANALETLLKQAGVQGTRITIPVGHKVSVYSNAYGVISDPGVGHAAIMVDDVVFDNMHPGGILRRDFEADLGGSQFFNNVFATLKETRF
jgi:hypothetical protein